MKKMSNGVKKWIKGALLAVILFFSFIPVSLAAEPITGDSVGNWMLDWGKWGVVLGVAFLSIKEFMKGAKVVAFVVIVAGSILYFYMNDPEGFLKSLDFIPKFFTGQ
ncbi:TcpD family membrane protein [Carnobacterium divergens]|uniref:TcpD family membrane protein n=1 Tax=Carnobacterium divergens TaxID=2748 RepID=UPI002891BE50|nr:TcpD family membrane protein [Carnobacterium divergens]MDT2010821.1 TcpD family membrane protein [Carnobacterium divergens]